MTLSKPSLFLFSFLFVGLTLAHTAPPPSVLQAGNFGAIPNDQKDDTDAFKQLFEVAASSPLGVIINVPPGTYDFFPEHATRRVCYASNATQSDNPRTIGLYLENLKNLTLRSPGAKFLMHGNMSHLVAENCENLSIEGISFDLARPTVSELTVAEVGENFWIAKVHPTSRYVIENNRPVWIGEDWRKGYNLTQEYDREKNTVRRSADAFVDVVSVEEQSPGVLKVITSKPTRHKVGHVFQFREGTRDQIGMWFDHCRNVRLQDVNLYALAGFGVLSQFTENITFLRVKVAPEEGSGRTCASAADIFHFSMCRGGIEIRDCVMEGSQDDAVNVHGIHFKITKLLADNRIVVRFGHPETRGFQAFWAGDEIEFVSRDTLQPCGRAKVTAVDLREDGGQELVLDQAIPALVVIGQDAVENLAWIPSVVISGCRVARIPTRGFLLTTRGSILVENNEIQRTQMSAILISDDAGAWFESGPVYDALIQKNTFFECGEPVIDIHPENKTEAGPVHHNIRIQDNTFILRGCAVSVRSATQVVISGNRFEVDGASDRKEQDFVQKSAGSDAKVQGNTVQGVTTK